MAPPPEVVARTRRSDPAHRTRRRPNASEARLAATLGRLFDRVADIWSETVSEDDLERMVARRDLTGIAATIDQAFDAVVGAGDELEPTEQELAAQAAAAAKSSLQDVADRVADVRLEKADEASLTPSFDLHDPNVTAWARTRSSGLVVEVTGQSRAAVRAYIEQAFRNPGPQSAPRALARSMMADMRSIIGLHPRYAAAVARRRQSVHDQQVRAGATVSQAARAADVAADAYRTRLERARALTIARTEILAANNRGKLESWALADRAGMIDRRTAEVEWRAGPSGWKGIDVCRRCSSLHETTVKYGEPFWTMGGPIPGPPAHPNCRCTVVLHPYGKQHTEARLRPGAPPPPSAPTLDHLGMPADTSPPDRADGHSAWLAARYPKVPSVPVRQSNRSHVMHTGDHLEVPTDTREASRRLARAEAIGVIAQGTGTIPAQMTRQQIRAAVPALPENLLDALLKVIGQSLRATLLLEPDLADPAFRGVIQVALSRSAVADWPTLIAEAVAEHVHSPRPRQVASIVGAIVDRALT